MIGEYDHLNKDFPIRIRVDGLEITIGGSDGLSQLVRAVRKSNYGIHRFMSEFVRQSRAEEDLSWEQDRRRKLVEAIEQALREGAY